ncbi:MAG: F0F1 ATP synthase subunit B [Clostridia bacterium]|nr:F0F1 ATP synthase subunit B [Clostridia bacterium]
MLEFDDKFFATFGFTVLNILTLFLILRKFLFKPVINHMEARTAKIQEAIDSAEETKKMIEEMKQEYETKLKEAKDEGRKIIEEYRTMANKEYESAIANAKKDASTLIEEARLELENEKRQILTDIKSEVSELVIAASEKVIKKNMDTDANKKLIEEFINSDVA